MKEKMITRTILSSTIALVALTRENGTITEKILEPIVISGSVTSDSPIIQKEIKAKYPDEKTVLVDSVLVTEAVYSLSVADFIKYGMKEEHDEAVDSVI